MTDTVDKLTRSKMMAGIRNKDTAPELAVRQYLHKLGFRYRLHSSALPGTPDIVLPRFRVAIFVNGCFWHRHIGCQLSYVPKNNGARWLEKFEENVIRDRANVTKLIKDDWRVITIWECGLRKINFGDLDWLPVAIKSRSQAQQVEWPKYQPS